MGRQHFQDQLVTRAIGPQRPGDPGFVHARRLFGPFFGERQPGVDQGVALPGPDHYHNFCELRERPKGQVVDKVDKYLSKSNLIFRADMAQDGF